MIDFAVGLEIYKDLDVPKARIEFAEYDSYKNYKITQIKVNSKPITNYFRGVKSLGLLGVLLQFDTVRHLLCNPEASVSIQMDGAEALPDKGANLAGYALLNCIANTSNYLINRFQIPQCAYIHFCRQCGFEIGNPDELLTPSAFMFSVSSGELMSTLNFAYQNTDFTSCELLIQSKIIDQNHYLVFTPVWVTSESWREISIRVDNAISWTEPARLGLFAADTFLSYFQSGIIYEDHVTFRFSPDQGLLQVSADTWHITIPTLVLTALPAISNHVTTAQVLDLYQDTLRQEKDKWTSSTSKNAPRVLRHQQDQQIIPVQPALPDSRVGDIESINIIIPPVREVTPSEESEQTCSELNSEVIHLVGQETDMHHDGADLVDDADIQLSLQQDEARLEFASRVEYGMQLGMDRLAQILALRINVIPERHERSIAVFDRDPNVVAYVRLRSNGHCELCGWEGFENDDGSRYVEVHHIIPLSEGGADTPENTVALCPNCHRALHHSRERSKLVEHLTQILQSKGIISVTA